jgi:hypothetical protein
VTITAPADASTVTASSINVTWTVTGQVKKQIKLYDASDGSLDYDSGLLVDATQSHTIPSGSYRNGKSYNLTVEITNATPLVGADTNAITVTYTAPPSPTNAQFVTAGFGLDPVNTGVVMTWTQTTYPTSGDPKFIEYLIYRTAFGGPDDGRVLLARITDPATTRFVDYHPASGILHLYELAQTIQQGADLLTSTPASDELMIELGQYHILTLVTNPETYRAVLTNVQGKSFSDAPDMAEYPSLGGGPPVTIYSPAFHETAALSASVIATDDVTAEQFRDAFLDLRQQLGTVCFRDGAGTKLFAAITNQDHEQRMGDVSGRWYQLKLNLRQENYTEGTVA